MIGTHLKSKINLNKLELDADRNVTGAFLIEALKARVKLATEALDVRRYIGLVDADGGLSRTDRTADGPRAPVVPDRSRGRPDR